MEETKFLIFSKIIMRSEYSTWKIIADIGLNLEQHFLTLHKTFIILVQ